MRNTALPTQGGASLPSHRQEPRPGEGTDSPGCRDPRCSPRGNPACRGLRICVFTPVLCVSTHVQATAVRPVRRWAGYCPSEPQEVEGPPAPTGSNTPLPERLCDLGSRCLLRALAPACEMGVRLPPGSGQLRGVRGEGAGATPEDRQEHSRCWPGPKPAYKPCMGFSLVCGSCSPARGAWGRGMQPFLLMPSL